MKSTLNTILIVFLLMYILSTAGCGAGHSYATLFDSAECIVDSRPDSVLKILKPIDTSLLDKDDKIRYILLLTEAKYKTGDFSDGDSLISIASRYYDRYIGSIYHLRAYYFQGCMLFRNGNNARAVIAFLNAERSGKIINDSYWLGLIYRGIADAFDAMYDHYSALEYYNLSYEEFMKIPENKYTGYSILDAGRAYFNTFEKDNYVHANKLLRTALEYADKNKDIHLKGHALELLSKCAYELGDFATALELMEEKWNSVPLDFRAKDWHHLGLVYLANGDIEKAKIANDSLKKYAPDMHWLSFEIFNYEGNAEKALPELNIEMNSQVDYFKKVIARNFGYIVKNFYATQLQQFDKDMAAERRIKNLYIILSISIVVIISLLYYIRLRNMRRHITDTMTIAESLSNTLAASASKIQMQEDEISKLHISETTVKNNARKQLRKMLTAQFSTFDQLCETYYESRDNKSEQKRIYHKAMSLIENIRSNSKIFTQIETLINESQDNLIADFKRDYPELKQLEVNLFMLYVLGFSPRTISVVQNIKVNLVYTRKSNLKRMIGESAVADKERYLAYLQAQT